MNPETTNQSAVTVNMLVTNSLNRAITISSLHLARVSTNFVMAIPSPNQGRSMHQFPGICKEIPSPRMMKSSEEWKIGGSSVSAAYLQTKELIVDGTSRDFISVDPNQTKFVFGQFIGREIPRDEYNTAILCLSLDFYENEHEPRAVMCDGVESQAVPEIHGRSIWFGPFKQTLTLYPKLSDWCRERVM
jgi:hypothetical protein